MNGGDILLFRAEEEFLSKIVAWGTNSVYSHVAVCVSPEMDLAIESMPGGGVRARDIRLISAEYDVFRVRAGHSYNLNGVISYLVSRLNLKYDTCGVLKLGVLKLFAKLGRPLKDKVNNWQKEKDYFCSELYNRTPSQGERLAVHR